MTTTTTRGAYVSSTRSRHVCCVVLGVLFANVCVSTRDEWEQGERHNLMHTWATMTTMVADDDDNNRKRADFMCVCAELACAVM